VGNLLINLPNLGYCSPLQKIDHIDKCLWYFYPSYGRDSRKITAESHKMYSYPYYLSVLPRKLEALKSDNANWNSCINKTRSEAITALAADKIQPAFGTGKENLSRYQDMLFLVITFFILITWMFEQVLMMLREISFSSLQGLKG